MKKNTLHPVFAETLKYYIPLSQLESRTLWMSVWHSDIFGRNDFLGEVNINLNGRMFDDPRPQWYPLEERVGTRKEHLLLCIQDPFNSQLFSFHLE